MLYDIELHVVELRSVMSSDLTAYVARTTLFIVCPFDFMKLHELIALC